MKRRGLLSFIGICATSVVLALSGCSSSGSSAGTTGGSTQAPNSTSTSLKGAPVVVGMICSCTGVQASALGETGDAANAWAASVNSGSGINGHPVKVIVKDDGGDPAKSLQAAQELVGQDKVVAIVGDSSVADSSFASYVQGKGVPVVGGLSLEEPFLTNPDFFPTGASAPVLLYGFTQLAKQAGKKSLGVMYCAESPVCAQVNGLGEGVTKLLGFSYHSAKIAAAAPSYTAPCLQLKSSGVDALFLGDNAVVDVRAADGCGKLGYNPLKVGNMTTFGTAFLTDPNFDGMLLAGANSVYSDDSIPAVKQFLNALDSYKSSIRSSQQFLPSLMDVWAAGKLFQAAATAGKITPTSTSADVLKGLYALKNETLGGLSAPLTYTKGKPAFLTCYFASKISSGKLVPTDSNKPACMAPSQAAALGKALAGG